MRAVSDDHGHASVLGGPMTIAASGEAGTIAASGESATIVAIATPPGPGERGVIRVSGARARELVEATFAPDAGAALFERRGLALGRFRDGRGEQPAMLLWMPAPHSFTREDVAELHLPGSPPLLSAALARLVALGAALAAPGEFTRRAFLSGRIDLTRAEGVLALVAARNEAERRQGAALLFGGLAERVALLRDRLEALRALCEASLDFDIEDAGHVSGSELAAEAREIAAAIRSALTWEERRARVEGTSRIVIAGEPNAGKSLLFNALAGAERALVSEHAGTTRDALSAEIRIAGQVSRLYDTAGLAAGASGADEEAQVLGRGARASADLVLWVADATRPGDLDSARTALEGAARRIIVWNKVDLASGPSEPPPEWRAALATVPASHLEEGASGDADLRWVATSGLRGLGLQALRAAIAAELGLAGDASAGEAASLGRELAARHTDALARALREVSLGITNLSAGAPLELFAEHLRAATDALDAITGRTTSEAILDRIFARFCLGK